MGFTFSKKLEFEKKAAARLPETTSYNFDMAAFYRKWLRDIVDAQATYRAQCMGAGAAKCECSTFNCTGEVPPAAPFYGHGYHGYPSDPAKNSSGMY